VKGRGKRGKEKKTFLPSEVKEDLCLPRESPEFSTAEVGRRGRASHLSLFSEKKGKERDDEPLLHAEKTLFPEEYRLCRFITY